MRSMAPLVVGCLATLLASASGARADEWYPFVQITCVPELGYFAVRQFGIWNIPARGPFMPEGVNVDPTVAKTVNRKYGIFQNATLQKEPFTCIIPAFKSPPGWGDENRPQLVIKVSSRPDYEGSRRSDYAIAAGWVDVSLNGKKLDVLNRFADYDGAHSDDADRKVLTSIEIEHTGVNYVVHRCVQSGGYLTEAHIAFTCDETSALVGDSK